MARRLFTLASAVSLVLCVAVCVLWVRSYWVRDGLHYGYWHPRGERWTFGVWSTAGVLSWEWTGHGTRRSMEMNEMRPGWGRRGAGWAYRSWGLRGPGGGGAPDLDRSRGSRLPRLLRMGVRRNPIPRWPPDAKMTPSGHTSVYFPHWVAAAPLGAPPLGWWLAARRRRRAARPGLCPA